MGILYFSPQKHEVIPVYNAFDVASLRGWTGAVKRVLPVW